MSKLPKRVQALIDLGKEHGWKVDVADAGRVGGADEARMISFRRKLPSGRRFAFVVSYALATHSQRWQALKLHGRYPVVGTLWGSRSATEGRDQLSAIMGLPLEERLWDTVSSLKHWLPRFEKLCELDWIGEAA